ncbi:MAG: hypothetical protein KF807_01765 [Xanthobacteraceae bacterium]|nr:hypothetical protein [Xanthobacteraceae bacterium]
MSTEREKLIEIWLDSASEREYQSAFRNVLIWQGYDVLQNTSHNALELGKDVIARDTNGVLYAYQLKGNPGTRLSISQWQSLINQIDTLVYQPVSHPSVGPDEQHVPVLVTNGEVQENVLAAIASFNARVVSAHPHVRPLSVISRGTLLRQILDRSDAVWPVSIDSQRRLLTLLSKDGDDVLPQEDFCNLIYSIVGLEPESKKATEAAIAAAHLVTAIVAANWRKASNFFEVIKIYTLLYASICASVSRFKLKSKKIAAFLQDIEYTIKEELLAFTIYVSEHHSRGPLINRSIFSEYLYFHTRKKMVVGLLSCALLDAEMKSKLLKDEAKYDVIWSLICDKKNERFLIGESIFPYHLADYWCQHNIQGSWKPEWTMVGALNALLTFNNQEDFLKQIPGPYYSLHEILEGQLLHSEGGPHYLEGDCHYRRSFFAEPLFYLVVRRNFKTSCKRLWPTLTLFRHVRSRLKEPWQFSLIDCNDALEEEKQLPVPQSWDDVVETASKDFSPLMPPLLMKSPLIALLFCLFIPYRMDFDVCMWLDRQFAKSWY